MTGDEPKHLGGGQGCFASRDNPITEIKLRTGRGWESQEQFSRH